MYCTRQLWHSNVGAELNDYPVKGVRHIADDPQALMWWCQLLPQPTLSDVVVVDHVPESALHRPNTNPYTGQA